LNKPLTRVANDKPDISALQNFGNMWQSLGRELTSTPDAMRGNTLPSGTPYALGQMLATQSNSLFELMTENKGLSAEDMMRFFIIDQMKKQLKNKDQIAAILDDAGITEIDSIYVPHAAIKRYNARAKEAVLNGQPTQPFDPAAEQGSMRQEIAGQGNKRFFTPDELGEMTWAEVFLDFEWDSIKVEVTNENTDKQAVLTSLSSAFQTIASLAGRPMTPDERMVFSKIMSQTGTVSPMQLSQTAAQPAPMVGAPIQTPKVDGGALPR